MECWSYYFLNFNEIDKLFFQKNPKNHNKKREYLEFDYI